MRLTKEKRGLLVVLFVLLVLASVLFGAVGNCIAYAEDTNAFDNTNILEDLTTSTVAGKAFDINDYPYDNTVDDKQALQVLNFVEYCYGYYANLRGNFALYVYLYNPKALDIVNGSESNKIEIAVGKNADGSEAYEKFNLRYCSKTDDKLFYKFKVIDHKCAVDGKTIVERVDSAKRVYSVAGFEIFTYGSRTATDYTVGGIYEFSGYSKSYGPTNELNDTLKCNVTDLETLQLEVHSTYFRTESSSLGKYHQNQLNSVYFDVPARVINKYGNLQRISAEWYEYKTSPILVTKDISTYNYFMENCIGYDINYTASGFGGYADSNINYQLAGKAAEGNYYYNYPIEYPTATYIDNLAYVFCRGNNPSSNDEKERDFFVNKNDLTDWIYDYKKSYVNGTLAIKDGTISEDLFARTVDDGRIRGNQKRTVDAGELINLLSFSDTHTGFQKFLQFGLKYPDDHSFDSIKPIEEVDKTKISSGNVANDYLIDSHDVTAFTSFCTNSYLTEKVPYIFRFANTDYHARPMATRYEDGSYGGKILKNTEAFIAEESIFLDFDIIDLTFSKDGVYKTIPVVADPIDAIGAASSP
ncbi:MAG: hypothetical protein RR338_00230, partial [Clostridia bacterium]